MSGVDAAELGVVDVPAATFAGVVQVGEGGFDVSDADGDVCAAVAFRLRAAARVAELLDQQLVDLGEQLVGLALGDGRPIRTAALSAGRGRHASDSRACAPS